MIARGWKGEERERRRMKAESTIHFILHTSYFTLSSSIELTVS